MIAQCFLSPHVGRSFIVQMYYIQTAGASLEIMRQCGIGVIHMLADTCEIQKELLLSVRTSILVCLRVFMSAGEALTRGEK